MTWTTYYDEIFLCWTMIKVDKMKVLLICLFASIAFVLTAQEDVYEFASADGNVRVVCDIQRSKIVTGIRSVTIKSDLRDEIIHLPTDIRDDIYLHITDLDTALFVKDGEDRYYFYHLVSGLSAEDRNRSLGCPYSRVIYPQHARTREVGGTVIVDAYLDELGCVVSIDTKTDIGYGLEKATVRAVKKCSCDFPPVQFQDENVKSVYTIPMQFRLD